MHSHLLALGFAIAVSASSQNGAATCREINIPITVTVPRFILNTTIADDWDAAALTLNLTSRDVGTPTDPIPIAGISAPVTSTYKIGATLCGTGETMLVLTHGIIESKLYWRPSFKGAAKYNFIDAALAAGYSVLSYDRIGVGSSSKVNSSSDAQFQVETAVLNSLVAYARKVCKATKVALVGHSYGAYLSVASASQTAVDAVVLTGFSGTTAYFAPFLAGAGMRVARIQDPQRWGVLDSGYLTSSDLYAETFVYFAEPYFEHTVAEWSYSFSSEPFAVGELPSLIATTIDYANITAPVMVLQGQFDVSACGGDCIGLLDATKALFTSAKTVETVDNLPAGWVLIGPPLGAETNWNCSHDLNLHLVAPEAFKMLFAFLNSQII